MPKAHNQSDVNHERMEELTHYIGERPYHPIGEAILHHLIKIHHTIHGHIGVHIGGLF